MNNINFALFQNGFNFNSIKDSIIAKLTEWKGHLVVKLQSGLSYLEDPRIASGALLLANFTILELATRVSQVIGMCLPEESVTQKNIKTAFEFTLTGVLAVGGNIAVVKATKISLNPIAVGAIILTTFIVKTNLEGYLNSEKRGEMPEEIEENT